MKPFFRNGSRLHAPGVLLAVLSLGCQLNFNGIPVAKDASKDGGAPSGTGEDANVEAPDSGPTDAQTASVVDAAQDAGEDAATEPVVRPHQKHASCAKAIPDPVPKEPPTPSDAYGSPVLDDWKAWSCEDAQIHPTCGEYDGTQTAVCDQCLGSKTPEQGVCATDGLEFPETCVTLHDLAHDCWLCVAPLAKTRACCLGLDVDCRATSGPGRAAPGELCGRHADCQEGLVCVTVDSVFGQVCACPGVTPSLAPCALPRTPGRVR